MTKSILVTFLIAIFAVPLVVSAQAQTGTEKPGLQQQVGTAKPGNSGVTENVNLENPFTPKSFDQLIGLLLDILIKVGTLLAFVFIIYSGFLFVTAGGSEDQINKAKSTFLWTIIGVAIVLGAKAIQVLITGTVTNVIGR